ncbi:SMI1/KNR4 family protein [Pseudomonas sp. GL93]|uniref:SMI1/KNR4 family protein n=1 Tax=Pseudomonas sp. GL93 TaxID=2014741 RepID=UPI000E31BBAA|nr:SMI1/KNR4 family protein [Pseudomonas sp. GL93]RFD24447.1 SMI1/KNR4 family protein [Pseudomonas sp. GL93]
MKNIVSSIENLSTDPEKIKLFRSYGTMVVLKNMGKVTGGLDKEYMSFLMETNGASILDYCFLGFKNRELGLNLYENIMDLWQADNSLAMKFWAFAGTSAGDAFGYLDLKNKKGSHFIAYYTPDQPEQVTVISSCFELFMRKFIAEIQILIQANDDSFWIEDNTWMTSLEGSSVDDVELQDFLATNRSAYYKLIG